MKRLIPILMAIMVVATPVLATDVNITLYSDENITSNTTMYADNITLFTNVNSNFFKWFINGYPGQVPIIKKGLEITDLIWDIESAINYIYGKANTFNIYGMRLLNDLSKIFVTRSEYQQQETNLNYLLLRVRALEHTVEKINETAYCQGKIETMLEYNLTSVKCGNTTYFNDPKLGVYGVSPNSQ